MTRKVMKAKESQQKEQGVNVDEAIMKRRSVRSYQDKPVSDEDLAKIIKAGQWAPNAGPYNMSVIRNKDLIARINEKTLEAMRNSGNEFLVGRAALPGYLPLYGAPVLIFLSGPTDLVHAQLNCGVSVESMLLQATELGFGSVFLRSPSYALNRPENVALAREVGIPEGFQMECGLAVGYTDDPTKFCAPEREPRGTVAYRD
jgi:FMN reductase [NAD(P)H]